MHSDEDVAAVTWMIRGQWVTLSLRAAIELDLFDQATDPVTLAALAESTGSDMAAMARLVRVLADLGLVTIADLEAAGQEVTVTALGATLSRSHPSRIRDMALMQTTVDKLATWQRLADAVRTGGSVFESVNGIGPWDFLAAHPDQEAVFDAAMARRGAAQAAAIAWGADLRGVATLVDVGGGRGSMLVHMLAANPDLTGVLADRPNVARAAEDVFADAGLSHRATAAGGDFFDSVPAGGEVYTLANILHDWPDAQAVQILRTIRKAMSATSRLWVLEQVLDAPGRADHARRDLHLLDLHMLVMFGARERSMAEYDALLLAAGFEPGRLQPTNGTWNIIQSRPRS